MKDALATAGVIVLAAVCCLLPLLIIGGIGIFGAVVWREAALALIGIAVLAIAFGGAAVMVRRRSRG